MESKCAGCERGNLYIPPTGPTDSDILFLGRRPGRDENGYRQAFMGEAAREFNLRYLGLAGLDREDIRFTNVVRCKGSLPNDKPTPDLVRSCASHWLPREIGSCQPSCIVLMGSEAVSLVPKIELDKDHGIPITVGPGDSEYLGGWEGVVVPMLHPSSGLHDTGQMIPLLEDFERLGKILRGKYTHPSRDYSTEYRVVEDRADLAGILKTASYTAYPIDSEDDAGIPWSVQFSVRPGTGYLIYAGQRDLLRDLFGAASEYVFHNASHDIDVLRQLGITIPKWRDTMQEAYHLGNLPQGLKALSWRLLGIRMRSWEDIVMPPSREKMVGWLNAQWVECEPEAIFKPYKKPRKDKKTGVLVAGKTSYKATKLERDLKRILSHSSKPTYDLWEQVESLGLSGFPLPSIVNVDSDTAIQYACQDADVTGQVATRLAEIRTALVEGDWYVDEMDWDQ